MYRQFTAAEYRKHLKLPINYRVDGFLIYGTFRKFPYQQLEDSLKKQGYKYELSKIGDEYFDPVLTFKVMDKTYWFTIAYGGTMLSEYLHLASIFGSNKNILLGSCGGLKKGASTLDIIIPKWSHGDESSAKSYQPSNGGKHLANAAMSDRLAAKLSQKYVVHRGSTVTHQAMAGETWEDVLNWSKQGYFGVEMEASTVFAVSNHFNVPSSAILRIGDNLIEKETVMDINYESSRDLHRQVSQDIFDVAVEELLSS
jgi:purine-nucleoside phosphorylase